MTRWDGFERAIRSSRFANSFCPESLQEVDDGVLFLARQGTDLSLCVLAPPGNRLLQAFQGEPGEFKTGLTAKVCRLNALNCAAVRRAVPSLQPRPLGLVPTFGFGDRLGMATPGHVQALVAICDEVMGGEQKIGPIFAQQSVRENRRTGRTPQQVLDDATWGAMEGGWRGVVGADADHLKTVADVDDFVEAGYSFFTIDPGALVDGEVDSADYLRLKAKVTSLPWSELETSAEDLAKRYGDTRVDLGGRQLHVERVPLMISAAKYGSAVAHVARMARYIYTKSPEAEVEISVDETDTPTSPLDHFYFASELRRLGIRWVSMTPRYVGSFQKAIDFRGDLAALQANLTEHAALATRLGPYKLGLHSGSDKYSVYRLFRTATDGLLHIKTAGTSYLEGLRVVANVAPTLFRAMMAHAITTFPENRQSYDLSADLASIPAVTGLDDAGLASLLDLDAPRQVLHVAFGAVLDAYGNELRAVLATHAEEYFSMLRGHFSRHLRPLC